MSILTFNSQLQKREISITRSRKQNDGSIHPKMRQNVCLIYMRGLTDTFGRKTLFQGRHSISLKYGHGSI